MALELKNSLTSRQKKDILFLTNKGDKYVRIYREQNNSSDYRQEKRVGVCANSFS